MQKKVGTQVQILVQGAVNQNCGLGQASIGEAIQLNMLYQRFTIYDDIIEINYEMFRCVFSVIKLFPCTSQY